VALRALPPVDARRAAWLNVDRYSTVWVGAWPSLDMWTSEAEFMEIACRYLGLPSPACAPLVGMSIARSRTTLDPCGFRLCSAALPGDGWRTQHDAIKWQLLEDLKEMGTPATAEVFGLFAPLLPQVAKDTFDALPARKRQGMVPDLSVAGRRDSNGPICTTLVELKTLHFGTSTYPANEGRCSGVARRASHIESEYLQKARALDRQWLRTPPDQQGPVELKLRSFGHVKGLVFGSWGEASSDVDWLLSQAATDGATRQRGYARGADDEDNDALKSALTARLQRRWGMVALRANARLLIDRLAYVGSGAVAAAARRLSARSSHWTASTLLRAPRLRLARGRHLLL
jgi:hypothetical protein